MSRHTLIAGVILGAYLASSIVDVRAQNAADALLVKAAASVEAESWPGAIARYLRGELSNEKFLDRARDGGEQTEARAYIGLKASIAGRRDEARSHLTWVKDRGRRSTRSTVSH